MLRIANREKEKEKSMGTEENTNKAMVRKLIHEQNVKFNKRNTNNKKYINFEVQEYND